MKAVKLLLFLFFVSSFALTLCALDITAKDGTIYKDATVLKVMPDGLVISYQEFDNLEVIKHINTNLLPDNIKSKYHLIDKTANEYDSARQEGLNAIQAQKNADDKAYFAKQKKELKDFEKLTDYLSAVGVEIIFKSVNSSDAGSIGYAFKSDDYDEQAPFGLICLLGESIQPGGEWIGKAYPLNKNTTYTQSFQPLNSAAAATPEDNNVTTPYQLPTRDSATTDTKEQTQKEKIPCYADYHTAMDYFSNHPEAIGK